MHLALGRKARFIAPILTIFKMTNFSNVIRAKELSECDFFGDEYLWNNVVEYLRDNNFNFHCVVA